MTRQRSKSASSAQQFSKSPRSPTTSLATTADLFDPQQPPKTLQDILLLAQSHYISHRYVQALSLYKLAAEHHHSLPACSSLYALYTSTQTGSGLVRSDTKAALILIHALRIWTARRWSSTTTTTSKGGLSVRSRTQDDYDELEEYFTHPRKPTRPHKQQQQQQRRSLSTGATVTLPRTTKEQLMVVPGNNKNAIAQSMESEYRHPQFLNWRDDEASTAATVAEIHKESEGSESESKSSDHNEDDSEEEDCDSDSEGDESDLDTDQADSDDNNSNSDDEDEDDEEQVKEEEARRLGLATGEIEDIIQKICHMIQKGVLGLDEPVLVEAVSMLRKIERGLLQEADALKADRARSVSLFMSSLSSGPSEDTTVRPALLLTQGIDLSFLNFDDNNKGESNPLVQAIPVGRSIRQQPGRNFTSPTPLTTSHRLSSSLVSSLLPRQDSPMNASIAKLSTKEQDTDLLFACAIRIRVMFTLGWVHQQKGEYHYGAQAYGVCSEIPSTGKRLLDSLQHQANVQRWTCKAFEHKAQEQTEAARRRRTEDDDGEVDVREGRSGEMDASADAHATPTRIEGKRSNSSPATQSPPSRNTIESSASSVFTSSQPSTSGSRRHYHHHSSSHRSHRPDISSPSSLSSSESDSASASVHGRSSSVSAVSSFSAALWSSGLFKSVGSNKSSSSSATSPPQTGLKIRTVLEPSASIESKDKKDRHLQRGRSAKSDHHHYHQQGSTQATQALPTLLTMTMTGHQNQFTKCGHCGQRRALMPLCKCKKVRYCGLECRLAHLETHRSTCSSSGLASPGVEGAMGNGADPSSSVTPSPAAVGVAL
ncbi:hypothetical protein BGZ95_011514 [Linnemannia exigua]|uniref:MYND-type domain-containing protein n=1 Tax=Linnemannia exigua TaxID=604196 RepID=A0AAD4H6D3_9FUNG|nr:hypothetical protein BGZ95_011514 [Linnemannia exigua]